MTAVDSNVLIEAHRQEVPQHAAAKARLEALAAGDAPWGIPVFCLGEFVRVVTHQRVFSPPTSVEDACRVIERLLGAPSCRLLVPGAGYPALYAAALREAEAAGNLAIDAQIVAVCREAGVTAFLTRDRDFARFKGFRTQSL